MRGHAAQIAASIPFSRQTTGRAGWHTAPMPTSATPTSIRAALASDRTIDIITTGARTGQRRVTEIWFCRLDDVLVITGTPGPRDWYANLLRHPDFVFRPERAGTCRTARAVNARSGPRAPPQRLCAPCDRVVSRPGRDRGTRERQSARRGDPAARSMSTLTAWRRGSMK